MAASTSRALEPVTRPRGRLDAVVALAVVLALVASRVEAHAVLVEATPADGARMATAPDVVRLRFDEPVTPVAVRLLDHRGLPVPSPPTVSIGADTIELRPGALADGAYFLSWRVTSVDQHPVGGTLRFVVGDAELAEALPETDWTVPLLVSGGLRLATLLLAAGAALFALLVGAPAALDRRLRRDGRVLAGLALASLLLDLAVTGSALAGLAAAGLATLEPWRALAGLPAGFVGTVTAAGLLVLLLGRVRAVGAAATLLPVAAIGHAATAAPAWAMAPTVAAHVVTASFWVGSLWPLWPLWRVVRALPAAQAGPVVVRFSRVATAGISLLLVSGGVIAWRQLGSLAAAWGTTWGRLLLLKLAVVSALLAVALWNRWRLTPSLARGDAAAGRWLARLLAVDLALAAAVVGLTAGLGQHPPPRITEGLPVDEAPGLTAVTFRDGRQAAITVLPGRAGLNRIEAYVTGVDGRPLAARTALLELSAPALGLGPIRRDARAVVAGVWLVEDAALPRPGRWAVRLDLLIDDFTTLVFTTELDLP